MVVYLILLYMSYREAKAEKSLSRKERKDRWILREKKVKTYRNKMEEQRSKESKKSGDGEMYGIVMEEKE
jgi:hypothetical protein